jgi:hypothetical protein
MAWVVGARRVHTYGLGIKTPSGRAYPIRLPAALVAAWYNRHHANPSGGEYMAIKLARGERT